MKFFAVLLVCGLLLSSVSGQKPSHSVTTEAEYKRQEQAANHQHGVGEGKLKPGSLAPDFKLKKLNSNQEVQLSSFANHKPVALIFGTYT